MLDSTVFVVGGSTGIGRCIAEALDAEKYRVVVFSRTAPCPPPKPPAGPGLIWRPLDLSDPDASRIRLEAAVEEFGLLLDAVFYSAVHYGKQRASFLQVAEQEWRQLINVNLDGLRLTLAATLPALRRRAPSLFVGISSEVVYNNGPNRSGYAATKAAAASLLNSLAAEETGDSVRFVQLLPAGMVETEGIRKRRPPGFDFSGYMKPISFQGVAVDLVRLRGEGLQGQCLVVGERGNIWNMTDGKPRSQNVWRK